MPDVHTALHVVQGSLPHVEKDQTNPHFHSKYASLGSLNNAVLPVLNTNMLTWTCLPSGSADEPSLGYALTYVGDDLTDGGDRSITGEMPLLLQKRDPQGQGSALTYGKRYALEAVLGIVAEDDDDGNAASPQPARRRQAKRPPAKSGQSSSTPAAASPATRKRITDAIKANGSKEDAVRMALTTCGVDVPEGETVKAVLKRITETQAEKLAVMLEKK